VGLLVRVRLNGWEVEGMSRDERRTRRSKKEVMGFSIETSAIRFRLTWMVSICKRHERNW
jgi:hypothetical protein